MIALFTLAIFFLLLVLVYPTICAVLWLVAWHQKSRIRGGIKEKEKVAQIDAKMDQVKNMVFKLSILMIFFGVAPFLALWFANF